MSNQKELIPMRPGDTLRHGRQQKGLSLERAARESRIKLSVIEAIETGEIAHIPSVYLKGYIRNYARFLGIDPTGLEQQIQEVQGADPEVRPVFTAGPGRGAAEKWLKISSYLAASVLIAALAWQFTHEAVRFSQGETGLNTSAQVQPSESRPPLAEPENDPGNGRTHLNASLANVDMVKQPGEVVSSNAAQEAWAALDNPLPVEGQHTLSLNTSADTWVEIFTTGEEQLEMDLIRAGSSRVYRGPGPFRVMIGRASAVVILLDGEAVDLGPHTRDNVANLVLAQNVETENSETESQQ